MERCITLLQSYVCVCIAFDSITLYNRNVIAFDISALLCHSLESKKKLKVWKIFTLVFFNF